MPGARLWLHGHLHCRHDYRAAGTSVIVFGHVRGHGPLAEVDTRVTWVFKLRDGLVLDARVFPTGGEALRWLDDTARESAS